MKNDMDDFVLVVILTAMHVVYVVAWVIIAFNL